MITLTVKFICRAWPSCGWEWSPSGFLATGSLDVSLLQCLESCWRLARL